MTPDAERSTWVEREIRRAEIGMKPIMPVLLDGPCLFGLAHLQHEDVRGGTLPGADFFDTLRRLTQEKTNGGPTAGRPSSPDEDPGADPPTEIFEKVMFRLDKTPGFGKVRGQNFGRLLVENGCIVLSSAKCELEVNNEVISARSGSWARVTRIFRMIQTVPT
jgi:hypothetical protein